MSKEIMKAAGFGLNEVLDVTISNGVITKDLFTFLFLQKKLLDMCSVKNYLYNPTNWCYDKTNQLVSKYIK